MLLDRLKENWILIISSLVVLVFLFIKNSDILSTDQQVNAALSVDSVEPMESNNDKMESMIVDVKGEVKSPGVYEVDANFRINDVIEMAGGFSDGANKMLVNLAQKVQDEMTIIVPSMDETKEGAVGTTQMESDKVRINYATQEEVESLNGIGPSKAAAIIQYREDNGFFQKIEDLLEVSGIGEKTLENLKDDIQIP